MDCSPPGSSAHGIFQARVLEWGAIEDLVQPKIVAVQLLSHVRLSATPWTAAHQVSLSFTIFWSLLKLMPIELVMLSNHLILYHPLLLLSIFTSIRVFSSESALCIKWPKYWSFSISPFNEYSGLSRVFSNTIFQKHQFFST